MAYRGNEGRGSASASTSGVGTDESAIPPGEEELAGPAHATLAPVTRAERVSSLDVLRGFSLMGIPWHWYGYVEYYKIYYAVAGMWLFNLLFSAVWLHYFEFGPAEWAWRSLTYWKRQPTLSA